MRKIFCSCEEDIKNVREELIMRNGTLDCRIDKLYDRIGQLERIMKYAKDEPTCRLDFEMSGEWWYREPTYVLYLYIDKNEYRISLKDLHIHLDGMIDDKSKIVSVYGNTTIVDIEEKFITHTFTIDYKKGTYVHTTSNKLVVNENTVSTINETPEDKETIIWKCRCDRLREYIMTRPHIHSTIQNMYCAGKFTANDLGYLGVELPDIIPEEEED